MRSMSRTTQVVAIRTGSALTTQVTEVDPRSGERRDISVITQQLDPVALALEDQDRGHETFLFERERSDHR